MQAVSHAKDLRRIAAQSSYPWLIDSYSFLQSQAREVKEGLSRPFLRKIDRVWSHLQHTARFDVAALKTFAREHELTLAELWAFPLLLKRALLDRVIESPASEQVVRDAVAALHQVDDFAWKDFVESASVVEDILRQDPAGVYPRMDFDTRDGYRQMIERLAEKERRKEREITEDVLARARESGVHIGEFLQPPRTRYPALFYFGGIGFLTSMLLWAASILLAPAPWWLVVLLIVPVSQVALSIVNPLVNRYVPPRRLPRFDFSSGVPAGCRSFVVIPTLLLSRSSVENVLERLEIHFLANRDPNLLFGLLTDFRDAPTEHTDQDDLAELCADGIRALNRRYAGGFYLFHRERKWNASEGVWMGHERKRGKLDDFNDYLLGRGDEFPLKVGALEAISRIRYVITLDTDTRLPRDAARELIAAIAHPLNRRYAILQPRVGVSIESAAKSRLANLFSGQTGLDPYTKAVSDTYQDLFQQASYTGKAIYDLNAFVGAVSVRFPENTLLSHDLIEGEFAHVGLITDVEVIDDYPATYEAFSKRKHRWVRGDWQIAAWLLPRVPDACWRWGRNPLTRLSRWKILDNLRRSTFEISLVAFFIAGLFSAYPRRCALAVCAVCLFPVAAQTFFSLLRIPPVRFWSGFVRELGWQFGRGLLESSVTLAFLLHQALLMADAIVRTLIRLLITRRRLLEWESMAQAESGGKHRVNLTAVYMILCPVLAILASPFTSNVIAIVLLSLWAGTPLMSEFLSQRLASGSQPHRDDSRFLRDISLRTWRYFLDFCKPGSHWLVPDNVQFDPYAEAHRSSPTNMGLQLTATLAAHDFGYITVAEFASRAEDALDTLHRLERSRGHFYNWYDTRTLAALPPRYLSSVDSGNLAAALLTFKQGCSELLASPWIECNQMSGLRDHCARMRHAIPHAGRTAPIMRQALALCKQLDCEPRNLFLWEGLLTDLLKMGGALADNVEWLTEHSRQRNSESAEEARYWVRSLNSRFEAVLDLLITFAPWLSGQLEQEFRFLSSDARLSGLMNLLGWIPKLRDLPSHYDLIEQEAHRLLDSSGIVAVTRAALHDLLRALDSARIQAHSLVERLQLAQTRADGLFQEMNFAQLFNTERDLLRIGMDAETGQPDPSHYDLLASEARTAVFLAIAKGDIPREAWFRLGRKLTSYQGHRTLLSWSGTLFEYLMPVLFLRVFEDSLLAESLQGAVRIQQYYCRSRGVPWGVSEAAHNDRDTAENYQYRAFGIPVLGASKLDPNDLVVAPYASMLALQVDRGRATSNLRQMAERGWLGDYGFFESIDFRGRNPILIRAYMAHHQGMAFAALANALLDNVMQRRFHSDPIVQATELLLQERVPVIIHEHKEERMPMPVPAPEPAAQLEQSTVG